MYTSPRGGANTTDARRRVISLSYCAGWLRPVENSYLNVTRATVERLTPMALTGLDFITSVSGAATALANVGPGLGDQIGPAGNFSGLSDTAKWLLSIGMLVGRLELLAVYALFTAQFWRS